MAQDIDMPTPEDKGKDKAGEGSKDEKPLVNGKKEEEQDGGCDLFHLQASARAPC